MTIGRDPRLQTEDTRPRSVRTARVDRVDTLAMPQPVFQTGDAEALASQFVTGDTGAKSHAAGKMPKLVSQMGTSAHWKKFFSRDYWSFNHKSLGGPFTAIGRVGVYLSRYPRAAGHVLTSMFVTTPAAALARTGRNIRDGYKWANSHKGVAKAAPMISMTLLGVPAILAWNVLRMPVTMVRGAAQGLKYAGIKFFTGGHPPSLAERTKRLSNGW